MIKSLTIDNFALIDNLNVKFESGLSIITGETGAGKSIILGALGLILGQRADSKSLMNPERKCIIEGFFDISQYNLHSFFEEKDLDYDDDTIIRREISSGGKSRAFVNDVPVRLDTLQLLGESLVDIHSQHQTLKLSNTSFQMNVLDAMAENDKLLGNYKTHLSEYKKAKKEYESLQSKQSELLKTYNYNSFLLKELEEANLQKDEKEQKEEELKSLTHADDIKAGLLKAVDVMNNEQMGVITSLEKLRSAVNPLAGISKEIDIFVDRIESLLIESNDLVLEVEDMAESTESDSRLIMEVSDRLQLIYDLEKKHNSSSIEQILEIQKKIYEDVNSVENLEVDLENLKNKKDDTFEKAKGIAEKIHKRRKSKVKKLETQVSEILCDLGMPNARLGVELTTEEKLEKDGIDNVKFMLSANKGGRMEDIGKVASGGELSRVMLAIKNILSDKKNLPTIIFDEIDTGVSGDIADKIGNIMTLMSNKMQVIAITHLPQIAGRGTLHYKVYKHEKKGNTQTEMKSLNDEERVEELAKMLSGVDITESAKIHARELLKK